MNSRSIFIVTPMTLIFLWMVANIALSYGRIAPEIEFIKSAHLETESQQIIKLQEVLRDLQLTEIMLKNHSNAEIERQLSLVSEQIQTQGQKIEKELMRIIQTQNPAVQETSMIDENSIYEPLEKEGFEKFYHVFSKERFSLLQSLALARKMIGDLRDSGTTLGVSEQYSTLYNQLINGLHSYGIHLSIDPANPNSHALLFKGFLFGRDEKEAASLAKKFRITSI